MLNVFCAAYFAGTFIIIFVFIYILFFSWPGALITLYFILEERPIYSGPWKSVNLKNLRPFLKSSTLILRSHRTFSNQR